MDPRCSHPLEHTRTGGMPVDSSVEQPGSSLGSYPKGRLFKSSRCNQENDRTVGQNDPRVSGVARSLWRNSTPIVLLVSSCAMRTRSISSLREEGASERSWSASIRVMDARLCWDPGGVPGPTQGYTAVPVQVRVEAGQFPDLPAKGCIRRLS